MKNTTKFIAPTPSTKTCNLRITDATGHTDINDTIQEITQRVVNEYVESKKWAYVGNQAFTFSPGAETSTAILLADAARLYEMLESTEGDITVTLTGDLVGGKKITITVDSDDDGDSDTDDLAAKIAKLVEAELEKVEEAEPPVFEIDPAIMDDPAEFMGEVQSLLDEALAAEDGKVILRKIKVEEDEEDPFSIPEDEE